MDHSEDSRAHSLSKRSRYLDAASTSSSSTPKRTRIAGSKNLKNHEWVLVHQHFLRRNMENKDTVFVIHGVKHHWHNVRRKIVRAGAGLKESQQGSGPLTRLPGYIELRSPSPELLTRPPVAVVEDEPNLEFPAPQTRSELDPQATRIISDTRSIEVIPEVEYYDVVKAVDVFCRILEFSELLHFFQKPDWRRPKPSATICTCSFGNIWVDEKDILQTFADKVNELAAPPGRLVNSIDVLCELIRTDHVSKSRLLETVINHLEGTPIDCKMLEWLASDLELTVHGAKALGAAVYRTNFAAVDTLLHTGVDINASVSGPHPTPDCSCRIKVIEYAQLQCFNGDTARISDEMTEYLLGKGAEESRGFDMCLLDLLVCVLHHQDMHGEAIFSWDARFLIRRIRGFAHVMSDNEPVMMTCIRETEFDNSLHMDRIWVLEELLERSTKKFSSLPLTMLIYKNGRRDLVTKLIMKTENLNSHCDLISVNDRCTRSLIRLRHYHAFRHVSPLQAAALCRRADVLRLLVENGADVYCPAQGSCGITPLQAVCWWETELAQNLKSKLLTVDFLLGAGADVNAAPAWHLGLTALQAAAFMGDEHVARFLISRGADVNAPACKYGGGTALAMAARKGHVNMVRFLLKAGADVPTAGAKVSLGETYDDYNLILNLLRISATELAETGGANIHPPRDYHEYEAEWAGDPTYENEG